MAIQGLEPECNCGRTGCLESVCSLTAIERSFLPYFLARYPGHDLGKLGDLHKASKLVRGLAEKGDPMCVDIFRVQAHALGLFFDEMVNTFDPDALIVGGGAIETGEEFQRWFIDEIRAGMPSAARGAGRYSDLRDAQRRHRRRPRRRHRGLEVRAPYRPDLITLVTIR